MQYILNDLVLKKVIFTFSQLELFRKTLRLLAKFGKFQNKLLQPRISIIQRWLFQWDMKKPCVWREDSVQLSVKTISKRAFKWNNFSLKSACCKNKVPFYLPLICSHKAAISEICEMVQAEYKSNYFGLVNLPNLSSFPWSPFLATFPLSLLAVLRSEWQRVISSSSEDKTH